MKLKLGEPNLSNYRTCTHAIVLLLTITPQDNLVSLDGRKCYLLKRGVMRGELN